MENPIQCWDFFDCGEQKCPAYKTKTLQCWLVPETHCRDQIQGKFLEKIEMCLDCEAFQANIDSRSIEATLKLVSEQFKEFRQMVEKRDSELEDTSLELALGLSEVFQALIKISSGDPFVKISETSKLELMAKLKRLVNRTADQGCQARWAAATIIAPKNGVYAPWVLLR